MAIPRSSNYTVYTAVQYSGHNTTINSQTIVPYVADQDGNILLCTGASTVTDGGSGFAKGCQFILTSATAGSACVYLNKGSATSCTFSLVTQG